MLYPDSQLLPGERIVRASGLVLVFTKKQELVYYATSSGKLFRLGGTVFRLLELLACRVGTVRTHEFIMRQLYDSCGDKRPEDNYVVETRARRDLSTKLRVHTGIDPIRCHYGHGLSFEDCT